MSPIAPEPKAHASASSFLPADGAHRPIETLVKRSPVNWESSDFARAAARTPTEAFYVRTNFDIPSLDAGSHRVTFTRLDGTSTSASLAELRGLGMESHDVTLECAGNDRVSMTPLPSGETWRGGAVSSAEWRGVPLRRVLEHFGIAPGSREVLFRGADSGKRDGKPTSFERSLAIAAASADGTLLALEMNGAPLPREHGGPIRLIMPRWYAMASVKWLSAIEARDEAFAGHFQADRYVYRRAGQADTPVREMLVKSMITSPAEGQVVRAEPMVVRGWAWSGGGDVAKVEIATDGEGEWKAARLLPAAGAYAWRPFQFDWHPTVGGHYILRSRATDSNGAVQPDQAAWNALGYGNNSIRKVSVTVA
jgi:DMSO/TMAO reductase YedYZ molybdopterin-dependent catalytic subunit